MTPQERQLVDDLFDRLSKVESAPRDPDAAAAIAQGLRGAPNAVYALVQTVLLQDEALKRANEPHSGTGSRRRAAQNQSGGFLDSMRDTIFGQGHARLGAECTAARDSQSSDLEQRPGAAAGGQGIQARMTSMASQRLTVSLWRAAGADGRRRRLVSRNRGGSGRRRGRRIAAAEQHPLDDGRQPSQLRRSGGTRRQAGHARIRGAINPDSSLARDAGINDIGSSAHRAVTVRASGLFDTGIERQTTMTTWISIRTISAATETATTPDDDRPASRSGLKAGFG